MIHTVADLLSSFKEKELTLLAQYGLLGHPTLIGNMYEGLSREIITRAIPEQLSLRVVDGKIRSLDGRLSKQIDCMLVEGEGEAIPYTNSFIYPLNQVIAVIEVKKNLYSIDLENAIDNLLSVAALESGFEGSLKSASAAFETITSEEASYSNLIILSRERQMLFSCLANISTSPVRIVLGYFGLADESSLREKFLDFLAGRVGPVGHLKSFGPYGLPSLILCGENALLRCDSMPFGVTLKGYTPDIYNPGNPADWWCFYGSYSGRSTKLLLEFIWTRLSQRFHLPSEFFGDGLDIEAIRPLLLGRPHPGRGWECSNFWISEEGLRSWSAEYHWKPCFLNENQLGVLSRLCYEGEIDTQADEGFRQALSDSGQDPSSVLNDLINTNLVLLDSRGKLRLRTQELQIAILPDGQFVAGENANGALSKWIQVYLENRK